MNAPTPTSAARRAAPALLALLAACGPGPVTIGPDLSPTAAGLPADPHQGGAADALRLVEVRVGRLVDVYAQERDGARTLALEELVVGEAVHSDGVDFLLATAHGTQRAELTILHPAGSEAFAAALARAHATRAALPLEPLDALALPPFPVVPRDAALELCFDDLVDPRTVDAEAVAVRVGAPPEAPFAARLLVDRNHGAALDLDGDGAAEHASTRVIVDLAVSRLEAAWSDPPLAPNPLGLPAAAGAALQNAALELALRGRPEVGAPGRLANLAGNPLAADAGPLVDAERAALVLGFRSGGPSDVTGDLSMGFLADTQPPSVVGEIDVVLSGPVPTGALAPERLVIARMDFASAQHTTTPKPGDLLEGAGFVAEVLDYGALDPAGVDKLVVRVVAPPGGIPVPGPATLVTAFDPVNDDPRCFVGFSPAPAAPPVDGVAPAAEVRLRFSEPMDPASLRPFDTFRVKQVPGVPSAFELVVGGIAGEPGGDRFRFVPTVGYAHRQGQAESLFIELASGPNGPRDLAGNALAAALPVVPFTLDPAAPTAVSGNLVLRFASPDQLYGDGFPELRGQFLYDLAQAEVRPRPVQRSAVSADTNNPIPSAMTPFPPGVQAPLVPLGSKLHALWRYADVGFWVSDETNQNVDIEGLSWAPVGGQAVADAYAEFQIGLGHSTRLPDEFINPMTGFPTWPNSGLTNTYAQHFLAPEPDGGDVVHPKQAGYAVNPADLYTGVSGRPLIPFPLNQGVPIDAFEYFTWRDTALTGSGGAAGPGVPQAQEVSVLGLPPGLIGSLYAGGQVRSIGLPLLMEFRCYPDASALGLNAFTIALSANSSARPNHRAFSSGGINTTGNPVLIDPDLQTMATGGFNPHSNPPGAVTPGIDNAFYLGQLDLVTRVSRAHTIWLPALPGGVAFAPPVVELGAAGAAPGTEVRLAFRGATEIVNQDVSPVPDDITTNAADIDPYGDPTPTNGAGNATGAPVFLNSDATWKDDLTALDGSSWFQVRVTFVGNAATNATAALSSLGIAFAP